MDVLVPNRLADNDPAMSRPFARVWMIDTEKRLSGISKIKRGHRLSFMLFTERWDTIGVGSTDKKKHHHRFSRPVTALSHLRRSLLEERPSTPGVLCSQAEAICRNVCNIISLGWIRRPVFSSIRATAFKDNREWPPRSKKLSCAETRSTPRTSPQASAIARSIAVLGLI